MVTMDMVVMILLSFFYISSDSDIDAVIILQWSSASMTLSWGPTALNNYYIAVVAFFFHDTYYLFCIHFIHIFWFYYFSTHDFVNFPFCFGSGTVVIFQSSHITSHVNQLFYFIGIAYYHSSIIIDYSNYGPIQPILYWLIQLIDSFMDWCANNTQYAYWW